MQILNPIPTPNIPHTRDYNSVDCKYGEEICIFVRYCLIGRGMCGGLCQLHLEKHCFRKCEVSSNLGFYGVAENNFRGKKLQSRKSIIITQMEVYVGLGKSIEWKEDGKNNI